MCVNYFQIHILDAGCGTGSYAREFLENGIRKISLYDASEETLSKAKDNLALYVQNKQIEVIKQGSLPKIPFADGSFDVVLLMQVLQHLDKPFTEFCNLKAALVDAYRVLKPGGVLLINHSTHEQLRYGCWYANLLPHTVEKLCDQFMPQKEMLCLLEKVGFKQASYITLPWEASLPLETYLRKDGPFDEEWRKLDSLWALAKAEGELESALKSLKEKKDFEMLDDWFEQIEERRKSVGRTTSIFIQKPDN